MTAKFSFNIFLPNFFFSPGDGSNFFGINAIFFSSTDNGSVTSVFAVSWIIWFSYYSRRVRRGFEASPRFLRFRCLRFLFCGQKFNLRTSKAKGNISNSYYGVTATAWRSGGRGFDPRMRQNFCLSHTDVCVSVSEPWYKIHIFQEYLSMNC